MEIIYLNTGEKGRNEARVSEEELQIANTM